jgi:hypothetical protein
MQFESVSIYMRLGIVQYEDYPLDRALESRRISQLAGA